MTSQTPPQDLEAFQRWALTVDDELREAVEAVTALENPDAAALRRDVTLDSGRSSFDLAAEVIEEAHTFKENPDRPIWFTPAHQMVRVVSIWAEFLMDYVDEVTRDGKQPSDKQVSLIVERITPAIAHFHRFLRAVEAAGYLSTSADC